MLESELASPIPLLLQQHYRKPKILFTQSRAAADREPSFCLTFGRGSLFFFRAAAELHLVRSMRCCLLVICALATSHFLGAEPSVYHVSVLADTDKTEGGELAGLIADDLRHSKDIIIDDKSPDFTVSCFAIHSDINDIHGGIAASVAIMSG